MFGFVLGLLAIGVTYVLATDSLSPPPTQQIDVHDKATQLKEQQQPLQPLRKPTPIGTSLNS